MNGKAATLAFFALKQVPTIGRNHGRRSSAHSHCDSWDARPGRKGSFQRLQCQDDYNIPTSESRAMALALTTLAAVDEAGKYEGPSIIHLADPHLLDLLQNRYV